RAGNRQDLTAYLHRCVARLDADPRLYTTSVAAADLETVRRELGYGKIDLYGGSYGATLAQAYVRRYPASARRVVLGSASLPAAPAPRGRRPERGRGPRRGRPPVTAAAWRPRPPPRAGAEGPGVSPPARPPLPACRWAGFCSGPATSRGQWTGSPRARRTPR